MHGESIKLCAVLRAVRRIAASAEAGKADRSAEERVSVPSGIDKYISRQGADVAALIAQADEAISTGGVGIDITERVLSGDGDYLPGQEQPRGSVPQEPPGVFTPEMHTRKEYMAPSDVAARASGLVSTDRAATHGDFRRNHANIGGMWTAYLQARFPGAPCIAIKAHDVACMMTLLKIARTLTGSHNPDDYVDACGYAAIAGGIAEQDAAIADLTRKG